MIVYIYGNKSCMAKSNTLIYIERAIKNIYKDVNIYSYDEIDKIDKEQVTQVIISGGDGIINNVVNYFYNYLDRIVFGFIPIGTANDFCCNCKIKNIEMALNIIKEGYIQEHNIYQVNNNVFMYALSVGNMSNVSINANSNRKEKIGKLVYKLQGIKYLFCKKSNIIINDKIYKSKAIIITSSNYLGGCKISNNRDNSLRLYNIRNIFDVIGLFVFGRFKKHVNKIVNNFNIVGDTIWCIDGEKYDAKETNVSISNFKIKMLSKNT